MGWALISHNLGIEKYIAYVGSPRAGKGTVLKLLRKLLGEETCGNVSFTALGEHYTHLTLRSCNVAMDLEAKPPPREKRAATASTLQSMTSNEPMASRQLYTSETIQGPMNVKFFIASNEIPVLFDDSGASASRVTALVFKKSFNDKEDPYLFDKLVAELPGIVQWSLVGLRRLIANKGKFTMPASSKEYQDDLKDSSQPLSEFIENHIKFVPGAKCFNDELYRVYASYQEGNKLRPMPHRVFIRALKETLLDKPIIWKDIYIGKAHKRGVIGIEIINPHVIPFSSVGMAPPSAPTPGTPC
jgi:putative DNA primase/helicase